ncbi:MAG: hypothetical protein H6737_01360 [Alphaproteobacteria bacterium]|nr:hypothetical protein [Alphaproteobacteria bacterium]
MAETPDERRSRAISGPRSSITGAGRLGAWLAMLVGQVGILALLWAIGTLGGGAFVMWGTFLVPLPALALAWVLLRPRRALPAGIAIEDWGVTLGHAWVRGWDQTYWMPEADMEALAAAPEPVEPTWTHAGFTIDVPPPHHGLPDIAPTAGAALAAVAAPPSLALVANILWMWLTTPGATDIGWLLFGVVCIAAGYGVVLAPWIAALAGWKSTQTHWRSTAVQLEGRQVRTPDGTFTLGAPGQRITLAHQELRLESHGQHLVIRGASASLVFLREAFEQASRDGGSAALVPAALGRLASRIPER